MRAEYANEYASAPISLRIEDGDRFDPRGIDRNRGDAYLTPAEARSLAAQLVQAADEYERHARRANPTPTRKPDRWDDLAGSVDVAALWQAARKV